MADKYFVDTNILLYAHDATAGVKRVRALNLLEHLWTTGRGVISTQVLQELCINLRRKLKTPLQFDQIRHLVQDYSSWEVVVNTSDSVIQALEIEVRYKLSFWDALIVQAAETAGASVLYSEDLSDGQKYGAVEVVNPLRSFPPDR
jgi:predicted nucleic acid-binding protein